MFLHLPHRDSLFNLSWKHMTSFKQHYQPTAIWEAIIMGLHPPLSRHWMQRPPSSAESKGGSVATCIGDCFVHWWLTSWIWQYGIATCWQPVRGGWSIVLLVLWIYLLGLNFQCIHRANVSAHLRCQISVWRLCLEFWWRIPNQFCWIKHS